MRRRKGRVRSRKGTKMRLTVLEESLGLPRRIPDGQRMKSKVMMQRGDPASWRRSRSFLQLMSRPQASETLLQDLQSSNPWVGDRPSFLLVS